MRIGVLARDNSWYLADLARAAGADHEIIPLAFEQLATTIAGTGNSFASGSTFGIGKQESQPAGQPADHQTFSSSASDLGALHACLVRTMPPGSLEQVVLRMDLLGAVERAGVSVINPPRSIEAAVDKYLTTQRLFSAGLPVPPTYAGQDTNSAMEAFEQFGNDVVVKPLFGGEGRGIARVDDPDVAFRIFRSIERCRDVIYFQRFIPNDGSDLRILLIGDTPYAVRRSNKDDWRANLARGAVASPYTPSSAELQLARQAADEVGTMISGVDLLLGDDGTTYVIEVNAVPGWMKMGPVIGVDIASKVIGFCESLIEK